MAKKITLNITEDMIKLISCLRFQEFPRFDEEDVMEKTCYQDVRYGLDLNSLYGGNFVLEDTSRILGVYDKHIEGTEESSEGPRFPKDVEDYLFKTHLSVYDNIEYIEQILHQFCAKGGITPGTYECKEFEYIWSKKE